MPEIWGRLTANNVGMDAFVFLLAPGNLYEQPALQQIADHPNGLPAEWILA